MIDTMGKGLDYAVRYYGDQIAILDRDRRISYRETGAKTNQVARALLTLGNKQGSKEEMGDRVGMLVPNCAEFLFTSYGIWKAGLAWTQLQPLGGPESWVHVLNDAGARTLVYHAAFSDRVQEMKPLLKTVDYFVTIDGGDQAPDPDLMALADKEDDANLDIGVSGDTVALLGYSGGTTGLPKGVVWRQRDWMNVFLSLFTEIPELGGGRFMHVAPLTHMTSLFVLPTWLRGGTNVVLPGFDPTSWFTTIEKEKITGTALVPTILYMLMEHPEIDKHDLSSLTTMMYGGSPMAPERLKQGLEIFGSVFTQIYACSEGGLISLLPRSDHGVDDSIERLGSAGRPVLTAEVRIVDPESREVLPDGEVGEISVRSEHHMVSYRDVSKNAETLTDDGFVLTGDIGRLVDGYLYLVDRKKDIIISGGFNVFPREVEDVIHEHPAVANVAVIGIPSKKWGEAITAIVILKPSAEVTDEEIKEFVHSRKGSLYTPKSVEFVESIPLTPTGKPDKKALRAPYWEGHERSIN